MAESHPVEYTFLHTLLSYMLSKPEELYIEHSVDDRGVLLQLRVSSEDMGRVIGRDGKIVKAIRVLLKSIGTKEDKHVHLKVLEPGNNEIVSTESTQ